MSSPTNSRKTGRVKFFNSSKGYGFIIPDDPMGLTDVEEVFVHHTAIHNNGGFKSLGESEEVEYDLVQGAKGMQAANVTSIGGGPVKGDPRASHRAQSHGYGGSRPMYNGGYMMDPYSSGYGYPAGYSYNSGVPNSQAPPFQYGIPMYNMNHAPPFGYVPPPFMASQQPPSIQPHPPGFTSSRPTTPTDQ
ncbi:CSD-domain-containing protein [Hesseltinella vesiculosa]|uniref:CSD-domain-containing protein n=1 Tax=Hesseltinella vesiculosa TaxID=101127 RepID=A0A1X2G2K5_9FUNG|nr:CSD-domain-containing protein [Hesseltinella vesiculosa]